MQYDAMITDRFVTATRFAEISGVGIPAISKAKAKGLIIQGEDRMYDLTHPLNMAYLHKTSKKREAAKRPPSESDAAVLQNRRVLEVLEKRGLRKKPEPPPAPPVKQAPPREPPPQPPQSAGKRGRGRPRKTVDTPFDGIDMSNVDLSTLDKVDVDKLKVIEAIDSARLKNDQLRRTLIDRKLVSVVLGRIHTVDVQEFLAIPIRIAPLIAGDFGRDDEATLHSIEKRLTDELYKCLGHVKRIIDDFLDELENDSGDSSEESDDDESEA